MDLIGSVVWRTGELARAALSVPAARYVGRYDARIPPLDLRHLPLKAATILKTLEHVRPTIVVELGAGRSTSWFAAYAARTGAKVLSFDENADFLAASVERARKIGPVESVHSAKRRIPEGYRYVVDIPRDADFIFVDGPYLGGPIYGQPDIDHAGKKERAGMDVPEFLRAGGRPKAIVVDGRIATVDAILREAVDYEFRPEFVYALRKRTWSQLRPLNGQSVFLSAQTSS